ncbi:hypothetical protein CHU98_g3912 [Xylaria longipes]|nr:hypothetical protein CHU98_g3912 [Xylaria longipes]
MWPLLHYTRVDTRAERLLSPSSRVPALIEGLSNQRESRDRVVLLIKRLALGFALMHVLYLRYLAKISCSWSQQHLRLHPRYASLNATYSRHMNALRRCDALLAQPSPSQYDDTSHIEHYFLTPISVCTVGTFAVGIKRWTWVHMHSASSGLNIRWCPSQPYSRGGGGLPYPATNNQRQGPHRKPLPWKAGDPSLDSSADTTLQYTAAQTPQTMGSKRRKAGGVVMTRSLSNGKHHANVGRTLLGGQTGRLAFEVSKLS